MLNGLKRPTKLANMRLMEKRGETPDSFIIREALFKDIPALAMLHVVTWKKTYPKVLRPPIYELREYQWHQHFMNADGSWFCFVIENKKGELVGFAKGIRYDSQELPGYQGELNKLYLLSEYQRIGLGRKLVGCVAEKFLGMNIHSMILFGIPENPSCRFHEALGGERLYDEHGEFHGGYGWKDLHKLVEICKGSKVE